MVWETDFAPPVAKQFHENFTLRVGDIVGLKNDTVVNGPNWKPLSYTVVGFDEVRNRVIGVPTAEWEGELGSDSRHFAPDILVRL
jgi:hypothetical protein